MTLAFEQEREHLAHRRVILDDQDCAALMCAFRCLWRDVPRLPCRRISSEERNLDGKDRALARTRTDIDSVAQQVCQALDNGETEAKALAALARRIVELMELARKSL